MALLALKQVEIVEGRLQEYKEAIEHCRQTGDVQNEKQYAPVFRLLTACLQRVRYVERLQAPFLLLSFYARSANTPSNLFFSGMELLSI
jgi:ParB-like chromosome segregation protein Spo0J